MKLNGIGSGGIGSGQKPYGVEMNGTGTYCTCGSAASTYVCSKCFSNVPHFCKCCPKFTGFDEQFSGISTFLRKRNLKNSKDQHLLDYSFS